MDNHWQKIRVRTFYCPLQDIENMHFINGKKNFLLFLFQFFYFDFNILMYFLRLFQSQEELKLATQINSPQCSKNSTWLIAKVSFLFLSYYGTWVLKDSSGFLTPHL